MYENKRTSSAVANIPRNPRLIPPPNRKHLRDGTASSVGETSLFRTKRSGTGEDFAAPASDAVRSGNPVSHIPGDFAVDDDPDSYII